MNWFHCLIPVIGLLPSQCIGIYLKGEKLVGQSRRAVKQVYKSTEGFFTLSKLWVGQNMCAGNRFLIPVKRPRSLVLNGKEHSI